MKKFLIIVFAVFMATACNSQGVQNAAPTSNNNGQNISQNNDGHANMPDSGPYKTFHENELGISFNYPSAWGQIQESTSSGDSLELIKQFGFTNQPDITMSTKSYYLKNRAFGVSDSSWLDQNKQNLKESGVNDQGYNVVKETNPGTPSGQIQFETSQERDMYMTAHTNYSTLSFSKQYNITLQNILYEPLQIMVKYPSQQSTSACSEDFDPSYAKKPYALDYGCMDNIGDSGLINNIETSYNQSPWHQTTDNFVNQIKTETVQKPEDLFLANYSDKTEFNNLGIKFNYPKVWEGVLKNYILSYNTSGNSTERILTISSLQDEIAYDNQVENCGGECFSGVVDARVWKDEQNIFQNNQTGPVTCADILKQNATCEIKIINGNKFLVDTIGIFAGESSIYRSYIAYHNGYRFEFFSESVDALGEDPKLYQKIESDPFQQVFNNLISSVSFSS